jgi:hypothetical protein
MSRHLFFISLFFGLTAFGVEAGAQSLSEEIALGFCRYSVLVGGGFQRVSTDLSDELSKSGNLWLFGVSGESFSETWGTFGAALGLQRISQVGTRGNRRQTLTVMNPFFDLQWTHFLGLPEFSAGILARSLYGAGSLFDFSDSGGRQLLVALGPQARYRHELSDGEAISATIAALLDVNSPGRAILQVPLQLSYEFP